MQELGSVAEEQRKSELFLTLKHTWGVALQTTQVRMLR